MVVYWTVTGTSRLFPIESETVTVVDPTETPVTVKEWPDPETVAMAGLFETAVNDWFGPRFSVTDRTWLEPTITDIDDGVATIRCKR